jgi:hypothetical protein
MIISTEYSMFTDQGNLAVAALVNYARVAGLTWPETCGCLESLARNDAYTEATDTAVRECVYSALGFKSNFYW